MVRRERQGEGEGAAGLPWNFKITHSDFGQVLILPISEPSAPTTKLEATSMHEFCLAPPES